MSEQSTSYDLVLFGSDLTGTELQKAVHVLAAMLKASPEQAAKLLEQKGVVIGKNVAAKSAQQARDKLLACGIKVNLKPHVQSILDAVGIAHLEKVFECPACGHKHHLAEKDPEPDICANHSCRVVIAKYRKAAEERTERDKLKQTLISQQQAKLELERKDREAEAAAARRRRMEDEIRRELGLPKMINSPGRLFGSAVGVHLFGVAIGVGATMLYNPLNHSMTNGSNTGGNTALASNQRSPGISAQLAIAKMLVSNADDANSGPDPLSSDFLGEIAYLPSPSSSASPATEQPSHPSAVSQVLSVLANSPTHGNLPPSTSAANIASVTNPDAAALGYVGTPHSPISNGRNNISSMAFLDNKLANLKTDTEWDYYLLTKTNSLLARGKISEAIRLIDKVTDTEQRFYRGAKLMGQLWNRNQNADAEALYNALTTAGESLSGGVTNRIEALGTVARYANAAGRKNEAEAVLQKIKEIAVTTFDAMDKAITNSEIAALLTVMGRGEDARQLFTTAVNSLEDIPGITNQLMAVAKIAPGYAKAGYRASALQLLEDAVRKGVSLNDNPERSQALGKLASISAQLGDMQLAMTALRTIGNNATRDQLLYGIITQEILAERVAQATDLAKHMQTTTYQALAVGFLGLQQHGQASYRGLAESSFDHAQAAAYAIEANGEKAAVISELARFIARSGNTTKANGYFATSTKLAETLGAAERDRVLAIIAANRAQALNFSEAQQDLAAINDTSIRSALASNIQNWQQAAAIGN